MPRQANPNKAAIDALRAEIKLHEKTIKAAERAESKKVRAEEKLAKLIEPEAPTKAKASVSTKAKKASKVEEVPLKKKGRPKKTVEDFEDDEKSVKKKKKKPVVDEDDD